MCTLCGGGLSWWDEDEDAKCMNCGAWIGQMESLTLPERRRIERILAIDTAHTVAVSEDVL
jgi:hypothetical protein